MYYIVLPGTSRTHSWWKKETQKWAGTVNEHDNRHSGCWVKCPQVFVIVAVAVMLLLYAPNRVNWALMKSIHTCSSNSVFHCINLKCWNYQIGKTFFSVAPAFDIYMHRSKIRSRLLRSKYATGLMHTRTFGVWIKNCKTHMLMYMNVFVWS